MRRTRSRASMWWKRTSWIILLCLGVASSGCLNTRGAMFLGKGRVAEHLDKTRGQRPPKGVDFDTYIAWRQRMADMPDGNRILGGFCTDPQVSPVLEAMDQMRTTCQKLLYKDASAANYQGKLFWGFLSTTILAGAGAFSLAGGAFAVTDTGTQNALGITSAVFGGVALVAALTNGFGGFDARQERHKIEARRVDNYMWSLRQRVTVQVCNAKDRATAVQQAVFIYKMTQQFCTRSKVGDGFYSIPTSGPKFDNKSLPEAPTPKVPPRVKPPELRLPPPERREGPPARREPAAPVKKDAAPEKAQDTPEDENQDKPDTKEPAKEPLKEPAKGPAKPAPSKPR